MSAVGVPPAPPRIVTKSTSAMVASMNSKAKISDTSTRGDEHTILAKMSTRDKPWAGTEKPIKSARTRPTNAAPQQPLQKQSYTTHQNKTSSKPTEKQKQQLSIGQQPKFNQLSQPLLPLDFATKDNTT